MVDSITNDNRYQECAEWHTEDGEGKEEDFVWERDKRRVETDNREHIGVMFGVEIFKPSVDAWVGAFDVGLTRMAKQVTEAVCSDSAERERDNNTREC